MKNSTNYKDSMLLHHMKICISTNNEQEYISISEEITSPSNNLLQNSSFNRFFGDSSQMLTIGLQTRSYIVSDFLRSFAAVYPDKFRQYDFFNIIDPLISAAVSEILIHSPAAYPLTDMILKSQEHCPFQIYSEIFYASAISENFEMFEYIIRSLEAPLEKITLEVVFLLYYKQKDDLLDLLFSDAKRDDISHFFSNIHFFSNQYLLSSDTENNIVNVLYDIALRYVPEVANSDNVSAAISEFYNETNIVSTLIQSNNIEVFKKLYSYGIKIRDISSLMPVLNPSYQSDESFREYILPLLEDKVNIDADLLSSSPSYIKKTWKEIIDLIGSDRITLEFKDNLHYGFIEPIEKLELTWILKKGLDIHLCDDITSTNMMLRILNTPNVLKYILEKDKFSAAQLDEIIDLCIKRKKLDALNIIRQYKNR